MLKLEYWTDEYKKEDGRDCCCCGVDTTNADGSLETFFRAETIDKAKMEMIENLKTLRHEIDELIKREEEHLFVIRYHTPGRCGVFRYLVKANNLSAAKAIWKTYSKTDKNIEYEYDVAFRDCCGFVKWYQVEAADYVLNELNQKTENSYELEFENWGSRSSHLDD